MTGAFFFAKSPNSPRYRETYVVHSLDYLLKLSGARHQAAASALMWESKQTPPVSQCQVTVQRCFTHTAVPFDSPHLAFLPSQHAYLSPWSIHPGEKHGFTVRGVYLFVDEVNGAAGVDVHKVDIDVAVDELGAPRHGVGEAALHLGTQSGPSETLGHRGQKSSRQRPLTTLPGRQTRLHFRAASGGPTPTAAPAAGLCTWPSPHR